MTAQPRPSISETAYRIERFVRNEAHAWVLCDYVGRDAVLPLPLLQTDLPLAEIYEQVEIRTDLALLRTMR